MKRVYMLRKINEDGVSAGFEFFTKRHEAEQGSIEWISDQESTEIIVIDFKPRQSLKDWLEDDNARLRKLLLEIESDP